MKRLIPLLLSFVLIAGSVFQTPVFAASIDQPEEVSVEQEIETAKAVEVPEEVPGEEPDGSAEEVAEGSGEEFVEESAEEDGFVEVPEFSEPEISPDDFADAAFYDYVLDQFDVNGDGCLSTAEAEAVTWIDVSAMGITDLGGIAFFANLETLNCADNELENLDVSANTCLLHLYCQNNRITSLNLANNPLLETLECDGNPLFDLVLAEETALTDIPEIYDEPDSLETEEAEEAEAEETELLEGPAGPLTLYVDGAEIADYPSLEEAFKNLSADKENIIKLHADFAPAKFTLPTGIENLKIMSDTNGTKRKITLPKIKSLAPSFNLTLQDVFIESDGVTTFSINAKQDLELKNVNLYPRASISVTADHILDLSGESNGLGKVSGTKTSQLWVEDVITVTEVATFGRIWVKNNCDLLVVWGKVSGIGMLNGTIHLYSNGETDTAVIDKVDSGKLIIEYNDSEKALRSKVTVTDVIGTLTIRVVDENDGTTLSPLPSGLPILTAGGTQIFTDQVKIENKDAGNHDLKAYRYNKEIRAEFAGALSLSVNYGAPVDYPNLEKAFEHLSPDKDNVIRLHTDLAPAKFTLPTKIKNLKIMSDTDGTRRKITLPKIKSLAPAFTFILKDVEIESSGVSTLAISAKKDLRLYNTTFNPFVSIQAGSDVSLDLHTGTYGIDKLSGTKNSRLYVDDIVVYKDIATFGEVSVLSGHTLKVMGKVSGIEKLGGDLWLASAGETDTAAIKTVDTAMLILDYDPAKLALLSKATVTDVNTKLTVAVVDYLTDGSTLCALPSGLPILTAGSSKDFTDKITIVNKDVDTHVLKAYRYGKEIRAEFAGALTLTIGGVSKDYPNFEEAFKHLSPDKINTIKLHTDLAPTKFTLPTKIDYLHIESDTPGTRRKLTLPKIKSLTPTFSLTLRDVEIESSGVRTFAINAKMGVKLINTTFSPFVSISGGPGVNVDIGNLDDGVYGIENISGTKTTKLFVCDDLVVYGDIKTFSELSVWTGKTLKVMGKVSGIEELNKGSNNKGTLYLSSAGETDTAVIKNVVNDTTLILDYDPAKLALLSKVTVTGVKGTLTIKALDKNDSSKVSVLPSGLPILTAGSTNDFTDKITIVNKDADDHTLTARRHGKVIKAEY